MRRALFILLGIVVTLVVLIVIAFGLLQTGFGKRQLLAVLEDQLADPPAKLQAVALEGFVPFDMTLAGATLSDEKGAWLTSDRVHLSWSPSALLGGTLAIGDLHADRLVVERSPQSPPSTAPSPTTELALPRLPVDIDLASLKVDRLELGPEFLGAPAVFSVGAKARLGDPAQGLQAALALNRVDRDNDSATLDIDYRPEADTLNLNLSVAEPQGGLITAMLGLTGNPKLVVKIGGDGPLADWTAKGTATLDDRPLLDLIAHSKGAASDRAVDFDIRMVDGRLLPPNLTAIADQGIHAAGLVHLKGLNQPIHIDRLAVESGASNMQARGDVDLDGPLDLAVKLQGVASTALAALLPSELRWDGIDADLAIKGTVQTPKLALDAKVRGIGWVEDRIGEATLSAATILHTDTLRAEDLTASLSANDILLPDPQLQPLVDRGVTLDLAGAIDRTGTIKADHLSLRAGSLSLDGKGTAEGWGDKAAHLEGRLDSQDLAPLLALGGLRGGGSAAIDLVLDKQAVALSADLNATTSGLTLGIAPVDTLVGSAPSLKVAVKRDAAGNLTIDSAALQGKGVTLAVSGTMSADQALALKADGELKSLGPVAPGFAGGARIEGTIDGNAADPNAKLRVSSAALTFDRFKVAALQADLDAKTLVSGPKAALKATARLNNLPSSLALTVDADPAWNRIGVAGLKARVGGTALDGKATLTGALADGDFTFHSADIGEIAGLVGQEMRGAAEGSVALRIAQGKQNADLKLSAKAIAAQGVTVDAASTEASARDLLGKNPGLDATLTASNIVAGGETIDRLNAKVSGTQADLAVTADGSGPRGALSTEAALRVQGDTVTIALAKLDATVNQVAAKLVRPAEIVLQGADVRVSGLVLAARNGTIAVDAALTKDANAAQVTLTKLPASLVEAAAPDIHMLGTLDGTVTLGGSKAAPNAQWTLRGTGLGVEGASEQLADLVIDGGWQAGRLQTKGNLALSKTSALDFNASLPVPADPATGFPVFDPAAALEAGAQGKIDLGILNAFIPGGADHVAGLATLDLAAKGALNRPVLSGNMQITDGKYENQRYGTRLRNLTADIQGSGSKLSIVSISATTPGGGKLGGSGEIDLAGAQPVDIQLTMTKARMIDAPIGTAVTQGELALKGTLSEHVDLTGKVTIVHAEIQIPDRLPPDIEEIAVVEVNASPAQAEKLAPADQPPPKTLKIGLDIEVKAPQGVFVRGRGLDAELGGDLKINGTADQPVIDGALNLRRGDFNLLSRQLRFDQGKITFAGGTKIDPILDFTATTKLEAADVTVSVGGTASRPAISLHSSPELPQDELLAQLLFGKASGALTPFEAVQLAEATAELAGVNAGPGALDKFRKTLGLDRLNIDSGEGATTGPSLSAGRYVSRGVFVGAKQGAKPDSSAATVEIELTPNVKVETDVGADSTGKAGINLEWNY